MTILQSEILLRLSGGASNTVPNDSLGGIMSTTTNIVDNTAENLFDHVAGAESTPGDTEYRGFYVLNSNGTLTYQDAKIWIDSETSHSGANLTMSLCHEGLNATMETIANENTAPVGASINFVEANGIGNALVLGDIPAGQRFGIWLKRVIGAATLAKNAYELVIKVTGDSAEA
jgi:hypothetical protein